MTSLNTELNYMLNALNPDMAKMVRVSRYREAYANAVQRTWRENAEAARFMLNHTNAFYIRKDERPRKGPDKDKPRILCEVCVDDPIARTELNMRQEILRLALAHEGIQYDEFRIIPAKMGMRNRHPFAKHALSINEQAQPQFDGASFAHKREASGKGATLTEKRHALETVKRAFCLALGEAAEGALAQVCAADLEPVNDTAAQGKRSKRRSYWLHLYVSDEGFKSVMQAYVRPVIARSRDLGLSIRAIQVHIAPESMKDSRAFPAVGLPEVLDKA